MAGAVAAAAMLGAIGCATITKGTTQTVSVNTPNAPGAQCTLTSNAVGSKVVTTPATLVLEKSSQSISVVCRKKCYHDAAGVISSGTETMAAGNIIAGGVIGLGIDAASGAMNKYNDDNQFTMVPIQGCKA